MAPEQHEALARAEDACRQAVGEPSAPPGWTDEELASIYEQSVTAYQCLVEEGYQPAEPPSLPTFMADYRSGGIRVPYLPHMNPVRGPEEDPMFPDDVCAIPTLGNGD